MKKLLLFLLMPLGVFSQNLIYNGSFEEHDTCPDGLNQVHKALGWWSSRSTPDYFSICGLGNVSVPENFGGYQYPADGDAYSGFHAYSNLPLYREFIGTQMTSKMIVGQQYFISFKVNKSDDNVNFNTVVCNKIGLRFTKQPYKENSAPIDNFSHYCINEIVSDTSNWLEYNTSFIADSDYVYAHFGNFYDNQHTDTIMNFPQTNYMSYYYIDNISITLIDSSNNVGFLKEMDITIYPNPADDAITLQNHNFKKFDQFPIIIYDPLGKWIRPQTKKHKSNIMIDTKNIPNGVYFILFQNEGIILRKKIIINHQ